ncbi:MAG: aminomethyl-transferring glycine dehydrogenase subunit GcvPA [Kiritimatiellae bacterium]|nr:aminomethyl-transferring glycine dehydrogenase subunit GcvPA [Kiritimatiellia bacterium]
MPFIANTDEQRKEMLDAIGVSSSDELFADIPKDLLAGELNIPAGKSEMRVISDMQKLANRNANNLTCFLGGGFYDHFIPSAVDALSNRSEFYTAYTPYQPEASQGTLQAIFEYQSAICRLTGMEVANASLYDGGTALCEAALMAINITGRNRIVLDSGVNPIYRNMIYSYSKNLSIEFEEIEVKHGQSDRAKIEAALTDDTAAIIFQNPNFFGGVDDFSDVVEMAHAKGCLTIASVYPVSLGILKTPGSMGVDIVTGEGQSLGIPLSFGGPYLGFMATRMKHVRKMPGRLVGETEDTNGKRGYVLTLQAREQHIRRDKATSNICSNESLCAVRAIIYMSLLGKQGMHDLAHTCATKAEYAKTRLSKIKGVKVKKTTPTFNEFTLELPCDASIVVSKMIDKGFAAGFPLGRYYKGMDNFLLVAITEKRTREEIGMYAEALESVL